MKYGKPITLPALLGMLCLATGCSDGGSSSLQDIQSLDPATPQISGPPVQTVRFESSGGTSETVKTFDRHLRKAISETHDNELDGLIDAYIERTFDENGCNTLYENSNRDDVVTVRVTYIRNPTCQYTRLEDDRNSTGVDGIAEHIVERDLNSAGQVVAIRRDSPADGIWNTVETLTYDSDGRLVLREMDQDGDGIADYRRAFTYDAARRELTAEFDDDGDTIIDRVNRSSYVELADGGYERLIERDHDNDGLIDDRRLSVVDADGNQVRWTIGYQLDGSYTGQDTHSIYNAEGQLLRRELDSDGDGQRESVSRFEYNSDGNLTLIASSRDGVETSRSVYSYENWDIGKL